MVILTKQRMCVDCNCPFVAARGIASLRCRPCHRLFVNRETRERDAARRKREKAAEQVATILGLPACNVVRDNGHRCLACRRVLWVNVARAPRYCHQCRRYFDVAEIAVGVISFIVKAAIAFRGPCVSCGGEIPATRKTYCRTTCSESCSAELGRRRGRETYERLKGVRLRPLGSPRQCRLCDKMIAATNTNGRGRSICDECNTYRGDFKSRARKYGVLYTKFDKRDVFARDSWRCQLCNRAVLKKAKRDKGTRRLHPRTASLDHIIPMSKGGDHVEANVQCACLACNVRKNAKIIGQLRFF